jgi:hypothetical protein
MRDDPRWVETRPRVVTYMEGLSRLRSVLDRNLHEEKITGEDKTVNVVVDIFNRVNSGGTKLSKGDLALAKMCVAWPEACAAMRSHQVGPLRARDLCEHRRPGEVRARQPGPLHHGWPGVLHQELGADLGLLRLVHAPPAMARPTTSPTASAPR